MTTPLRDQIAHAMAHAPGTVYQACNDDMYLRLADAVMPVVEHEILAMQVDATRRADELAARLQEAEELLRELTDIRPCDMRGRWCQAHLEKAPCPQGEAQRYLAALDQPEEP